MKRYIIIGHCNNALSMILESIQQVNSKNNEDISIQVIYCEEDVYDMYYGNPYRPFKNIDLREMSLEDFHPETIIGANLLIASMDSSKRQNIYKLFASKYGIVKTQYNFIHHPSTVVASTVKIGNGCYFGPNATMAPFANIKSFTYINRNATVGHHTSIGEFCTLNPGSNIGGESIIGNNVTIGIGANVFDNIVIGENVTIGAGSVVTKNIPSNTIVYGVPAKIIREKK